MGLVERVVSRQKAAHTVRILIDRDATLKARQRFPSMGDQIVGSFDSSLTMYRIFDGEELVRILRTGKITGGTYSAKPERAHGASWAHNITDVIEIGNHLRGKRYGDDLFLAKLDATGIPFHHLDPKVSFDPEGAAAQPAVMEDSACSFGLGCSMTVDLDDVDLFVVHADHQIQSLTTAEAKEYVEKRPKKDVDLREIHAQLFQGTIFEHDVRVWLDRGKWKVILNDDRAIVDDAPTKEDAIELARMAIRSRPGRPIHIPFEVLLRKRRHDKHFEQDDDPEKTRGDFALKSRDSFVVLKGSRGLGVPAHAKGIVADVYQRTGERNISVKLLINDKPITLYAQHPNRLGDSEIALMNSRGDRILIQKRGPKVGSGVDPLALRVALRFASYFKTDDIVLMGKYKNSRGKIIGFGFDKWGNPTVEVEPIPKGRKQNKIIGLYKIWRADVKEKVLAEQAAKLLVDSQESPHLAARVAARYKHKKKVKTQDGGEMTVYEYSDRQVANRNKKKAERIEALRKSIGKLRTKMRRDLKSDDPETSMTALVVALVDSTFERIGNEGSAKDGHFGVTGWKKKHVTFGSGGATIKYVGKSGVKHEKKVTDAVLKKALKAAHDACDGENKGLFEWDGGSVTAEKVNEYLEPFDVTAKDLRGFHANRETAERLRNERKAGGVLPKDKTERAKKLKAEFLAAIEGAAEAVGHESSTLRSQYLVPSMEDDYLQDGTVSETFAL